VSNNDKETLDEIERNQTSLRESIAEAKDLAAKSDRLIRRYRKKADRD
jgi:hypothetical protein